MIGMSVGVSLDRTGVRYTSVSIKTFHAHGKTTLGIDCETANFISAISWRHKVEKHPVGEALGEILSFEHIYIDLGLVV